MLFLGSRFLPPPNPLPLGGGTAQWNFPLCEIKQKIIYNTIIYIFPTNRKIPLSGPSGRGLGGP